MLLEIDTRLILGSTCSVALSLDDRGRSVVVLHDSHEAEWISYRGKDRKEARDAFLHTFARSNVPNVFARKVEA
jgi:hypothetical protein